MPMLGFVIMFSILFAISEMARDGKNKAVEVRCIKERNEERPS